MGARDVLLTPEELRHRAELVGGQRVERVVAHGRPFSGAVGAFAAADSLWISGVGAQCHPTKGGYLRTRTG
jgi:hypothetical protein